MVFGPEQASDFLDIVTDPAKREAMMSHAREQTRKQARAIARDNGRAPGGAYSPLIIC